MVTSDFNQTFKDQLMSILFKLFQKPKEATFSNTFYEASIILIVKWDKNSRRNYKPMIAIFISLMNTDAKSLQQNSDKPNPTT